MKNLQPTLLRTALLSALSMTLPAAPVFALDVQQAATPAAPAAAAAPGAAAAPVAAAALPALSDAIQAQAILQAMERVADWQLANPSKHKTTDWTQGVGDTGIMALAGISGSSKYRDAMIKMGEGNGWGLGKNRYHADDQIVGQTYAELYLQLRDPKMLAPMRAQLDDILANPHEGTLQFTVPGNQDRWSWCDALFMAPPAWARLTAATGDARYLDTAISHWWRTSDFLYDAAEHLYFRDSNYFDKREANGKKVYWGRGNGWVMGGLVRMMQYLPANHPGRARFEQQFKEMSAKLLTLQQSDGLWRASLLDPASYPMKESSGSALYTYAFAWGVNQGLLDRAQYEPAVRKAWGALVANVQNDGKLTHVQPIGLAPKVFDDNATEIYGVGGFLLAGSEVYRLAVLEKTRPQVVTANNPGLFFRSDETIETPLPAAFKSAVVIDAQTSRVLNTQTIGQTLLFQANFAPGETRRYLVLPAAQVAGVPPADVKTHARFVPERLDDFAWESDRIIHRVYGPAIIADPKEKLISSGVDVWVKSVRYPVIDNWYKTAKYHKDAGEGLDYYHVGSSRGCGGLSVVAGNKMVNSSNFTSWKILADGPLRSTFELTYDTWNAGGRKVSEVKRISIDAGSNFSRIESTFASPIKGALNVGIGIAQRKGEGHFVKDAGGAYMSYWEPEMAPNGSTACSVIIPGGASTGFTEADQHYYALGKAQPGTPFVHYFGAGWSKSGDFSTADAWEAYVKSFAQRLKTPLKVSAD